MFQSPAPSQGQAAVSALEELQARRAAITKQIEALRRQARARAIAEIQRLLSEQGLSISDVMATAGKSSGAAKGAGKKVAPKYRDPSTGQTWSGRGLKPKWLVQAITVGRSAEDFLI